MIPILFKGDATNFNTNGIGRLRDCLSCEVVEERNGVFELSMTYPTNGIHYNDIKVSNLIVVKPNQKQDRQAFEIYEITKPINQIVTVKANHISYRQSYIPVIPFIATGIQNALSGLNTNAVETSPFTFWTDVDNDVTSYNQSITKSMRACLGGSQGSILDTFSGSGTCEYEWDNFNVKLWKYRGSNNGVQLRFRKNITDLEQNETIENTITGVLPIWNNQDQTISLRGDIQYSPNVDDYPNHRTVVLDLSAEFEYAPTVAQLNQARTRYLGVAIVNPQTNIKVSFVDLSNMSLYEDVSVLERVNLCDTVKVIYSPLNVSFDSKVIKTTWDVLKDRYSQIEIGNPRSNIAKTISDNVGDISSLKLSNNKLVSVTQTIDRELGEVQTTVASVEERTGATETNIANMQISVNGIQTQVSQTQSNLVNNYATKSEVSQSVSSLSTTIQQTAQDISLTISDVQSTISDQGEQITTLETYIKATNRGLEIGRNTDNVTAVLGNNELGFYNESQNKLAWLNTDDGLGASALSIGNANTPSNRWRVITRQNGSHLTLTRHT